MKHCLFLTLNGINEPGGGGIYARTILAHLKAQGYDVDVISKRSGHDGGLVGATYKKTILADFLSRVFLFPTFLGVYIPCLFGRLFRRDYTCIAVHSSRCGTLGLILSFFFRVPVIVFFDNVEQLLARQSSHGVGLKAVLNRVDSFLLSFTEKYSYIRADLVSFITAADANYFDSLYGERPHLILPVKVPPPAKVVISRDRCTFLFTGTFSFYPNLKAAGRFLKIASMRPNYKFVLAGLEARKIVCNEHNVEIIDSPNEKKMIAIFRSAICYVAPIKEGSGMKTKVAEALSFGLPVVASSQALVGYGALNNCQSVAECLDVEDFLAQIDFLHQLCQLHWDEYCLLADEAKLLYQRYYQLNP